MLQLTQKLSSGEMEVQEVPSPQLDRNKVLIRNHYSVISAGTEGSTVKAARKSLIGKARERPQQVKQVIDTLKKVGSVQTYRAVMKKLDAYSPLGYSSAGEVIKIGENVREFKVGDRVACAGIGYANHAEIICVPVNLCVKLSDTADLRLAAYNTLGAIAMQGVRQADLRIGEICVVIGLGLIGQLTCHLLKTAGIKTYGIDISQQAVDKAQKYCTDYAWLRSTYNLVENINNVTRGYGVDAVIITAGTSSLDPIDFAGKITRKKGKVVVVGTVPTGFDREQYYKKELELRMSSSYGPGRYDPNYEEKGIDYPYAYVRWTEKRNMESFQDIIQSGKIPLEYLTTHEFTLAESPKAYDIITQNGNPYLGILIKYDVEKKTIDKSISLGVKSKHSEINIGFIGAGSYAQSNLLPNIPKVKSISLKGIITNSGTTSKRVAEKYQFEFCTSNKEDIIENNEINTIFIATRHDTHAEYVIESLKNYKNVFVEKPLAISQNELDTIIETYENLGEDKTPHLMVGFNRRFAPLALELRNHLTDSPMSITYRINSGFIEKDSWIQDMEFGGGRVVGEVCHFIDFLTWVNGSLPVNLFANSIEAPENLNDIVSINLSFANGSIGTINYFANGGKSLPKERVEIYQNGATYVLEDFKVLDYYTDKRKTKKLLNQDKGQKQMLYNFFQSLKSDVSLITSKELFVVTSATFKVLDSIRKKEYVKVV